MTVYADVVMAMNFAVNLLLLLAANRLCAQPAKLGRLVLGAAVGGLHSAVCLISGFAFLGNLLWRSAVLAFMCVIAFGLQKSTVKRALIFALLELALCGAAVGIGKGSSLWIMGAAAGILLISILVLRHGLSGASYVPVELQYADKRVCLTALRDTGNTLRDPVTGKSVLVVGAETAAILTGLTRDQLRRPLESMDALPGLRLIPYRAVGVDGGLLLALKLQDVKIGQWRGSSLVAFAPDGLGMHTEYQALTGGTL